MHESLKVPLEKIHFIPLGADIELFSPDVEKRERFRKTLGLAFEDVIIIYTGKLLPSKRVHDLLMASQNIIKKNKNCKIILVGEGPESYMEKLERIADTLGIRKNVYIFKTLHRTELPKFYNAADIAVWPGAFSISIIEAMACGLPIIIAKSDWTSHYLEYENGYSFIAGDIPTLSSLLLTLVKDYEKRKILGIRSRRLVVDKLNWDIITEKYISTYRSLIKV